MNRVLSEMSIVDVAESVDAADLMLLGVHREIYGVELLKFGESSHKPIPSQALFQGRCRDWTGST
ncbi:MAG: hypothetical protein PUN43_01000 [Candidatus Liberibacter asiaticus]|nr:hypothetical protein [Candidatus Liberibacter asiaticus]